MNIDRAAKISLGQQSLLNGNDESEINQNCSYKTFKCVECISDNDY